MMSTKLRPTISNSMSVACLRILVQMSMEKMVAEELKMEVREDMRAASITASISPERPEKSLFLNKLFASVFEQLKIQNITSGVFATDEV